MFDKNKYKHNKGEKMKIEKMKECTGCGLCSYYCPKKCIDLISNKEGFQEPKIDKEKCIKCGICEKKCPILSDRLTKREIRDVISAQLKDENILLNSASGGAFMGIASYIIENGGYVIGVVDDINKGANFEVTNQMEELFLMQGSKYYQCDLKNEIFVKINELLLQKKLVFFVGTPCQVIAVQESIRNKKLRKYLILADIICQGVPSKKVVEEYHKYIEKIKKKKIVKHFYRNKTKVILGDYTSKLEYEDKSFDIIVGKKDLYNCSFQYYLYLREACYSCKFTNCNRMGDITLGDFWGISDVSYDVKKGVSVILINSLKGKYIFNKSLNKFYYDYKKVEDILPYNYPLTKSCKRPILRSISYKLLEKVGFKKSTSLLLYRYYLKKLLFNYLKK